MPITNFGPYYANGEIEWPINLPISILGCIHLYEQIDLPYKQTNMTERPTENKKRKIFQMILLIANHS